MQTKVENLAATNALTKEDLAICKSALFKAQEENRRLLNQLEMAHTEDQSHQRHHRASGNSEGRNSSTSESSISSPTNSGDRSASKVMVLS